MKRLIALSIIAAVALSSCSPADEELAGRVSLTIETASAYLRSISTNGGYVGIYSLDLKERYGEGLYEKAAMNEIWVQPPGTPTIGQCFLRAWKISGDSNYFDAARECARALVWAQRAEGGWDHRADVSHLTPDAAMPERHSGRCTFDDRITQGTIEFLIDLDQVIDEAWLDESIAIGMKFMIDSQFENGAWPQWYPLRGGYHDYYTFNDNAFTDNIRLLLKAHTVYGDNKYLDTATKGGEFIIHSQVSESQPGWAQQYSHDMKPAWARAFEPPAVCSAVTSRNIRILIELYDYTGDEKYLEPIPTAIQWLNQSKIGDNLWARMYEVGTNRPIYGDRDEKIHYTLEEISEERRAGYSWQSEYGVGASLRMYERALKNGPAGPPRGDGGGDVTDEQKKRRRTAMESEIEGILQGLDSTGRWVNPEDNRLYVEDFVRNMNRLLDYLELDQ
jgi:hypothetical protein